MNILLLILAVVALAASFVFGPKKTPPESSPLSPLVDRLAVVWVSETERRLPSKQDLEFWRSQGLHQQIAERVEKYDVVARDVAHGQIVFSHRDGFGLELHDTAGHAMILKFDGDGELVSIYEAPGHRGPSKYRVETTSANRP